MYSLYNQRRPVTGSPDLETVCVQKGALSSICSPLNMLSASSPTCPFCNTTACVPRDSPETYRIQVSHAGEASSTNKLHCHSQVSAMFPKRALNPSILYFQIKPGMRIIKHLKKRKNQDRYLVISYKHTYLQADVFHSMDFTGYL